MRIHIFPKFGHLSLYRVLGYTMQPMALLVLANI